MYLTHVKKLTNKIKNNSWKWSFISSIKGVRYIALKQRAIISFELQTVWVSGYFSGRGEVQPDS